MDGTHDVHGMGRSNASLLESLPGGHHGIEAASRSIEDGDIFHVYAVEVLFDEEQGAWTNERVERHDANF